MLSRKNINQNPLTHGVYWFIYASRRIRFRDRHPDSLDIMSGIKCDSQIFSVLDLFKFHIFIMLNN